MKKMYESRKTGHGKSYNLNLERFYSGDAYKKVKSNLSKHEIILANGLYEMIFPEQEIIIEQNPFNL